jgi:hypothetical protein
MKTDVTFGGYPVELSFIGNNTLVTCKGVTGTIDQLDYWLHNHNKNNFEKFYFGIGDKLSEIVRNKDNDVEIACLKEDYFGFKLKLNQFIHGVNKGHIRRGAERFIS